MRVKCLDRVNCSKLDRTLPYLCCRYSNYYVTSSVGIIWHFYHLYIFLGVYKEYCTFQLCELCKVGGTLISVTNLFSLVSLWDRPWASYFPFRVLVLCISHLCRVHHVSSINCYNLQIRWSLKIPFYSYYSPLGTTSSNRPTRLPRPWENGQDHQRPHWTINRFLQ